MDERKYGKASPTDLDETTLVLTVNERLSRWLQLQHNRRKKYSGAQIWSTPSIKSLDTWAREVWQSSWPNKHLLNATQSQSLWENIIRKDFYSDNNDLLHLRGAAELAGKAYKLIKQYRLPESETPYIWTEESQSFHRWMKEYESKLQKLNSIDSSSLIDELISLQKKDSQIIPEKIIFAGFDEINPQLDNWLRFLETNNVQIRFLTNINNIGQNNAVHVRHYSDRSQEVVQCARWIRSIYSEKKTIGIVVPELESYRPIINREFTSELSPQAMFPWNETELPFNISQGTSLKDESAIKLAILIISAPHDHLPYKTFYSFLTSPFIKGSEQEISGRIYLEKILRRNNILKIYFNKIEDWSNKESIPQVISFLKTLHEFLGNENPVLPSTWAKKISKLLKQVGWPFGDRDENNTLYPLLDKWNECLDTFASLDQIIGSINRKKAIDTLNKITEIPFRKKTPEEPIQVVGMLESSGLDFDYLWVMGCDMKSLPQPPSPNPFIPFNLQKQHDLPHSTAERELNFSQQIISRLLVASHKIVFSYAKWQDNSEQLLSPLLVSLDDKSPTPVIDKTHSPALQIENSSALEIWNDKSQIPVSNAELQTIKGGHSILGNMAMCPFRAFSIHRLHTQHWEDTEIDIDAAKRGDLVHKALELFWKDVKSHANLLRLSDEDGLVAQVKKNVNDAIKNNLKNFFHQPNFMLMEKERIQWLILDWLQNDLSRPPFTVQSTEEQINLNIDQLNLTLKIDRVDQTESGETVIIDYKTGKPNLSEWFQDRLTQPQLPLYSLNRPASAIVFAVVKKNSCDFKGIATNKDVIPDIRHDIYKKYSHANNWEDQMGLWKENLNNLSRDFIAGKLDVDPVDIKQTCKYCGLYGLCKIGEQEIFEPGDELNG